VSQDQIIADIRREAEKEAEAIRAQHRDSIARRRDALKTREEEIDADARARSDAQERDIRDRAARNAEQEVRRINRALEERAVRTVLARVRERLLNRRNADDYTDTITAWALEAVTGLGESSGSTVVLRCSPEDYGRLQPVVPGLETRCDVTIRIESSDTLIGTIGVVALDQHGRRAYSNTLDDRLRRAEQDIHRLVMGRLFDGSKKDE